MSNPVSHIKKPIKNELKIFNKYFKETLKSNHKLLNTILKYIVKNKGKQLRPVLTILTAKLCGKINNETYVAASLVELLHTATLVHDDVVDNSQIRRGVFSIKALWKSKLAVLVGDYLLALGLKISVDNKAFEILEIVSNAVQEMSEGELLQIEKSKFFKFSEKDYFKIIKKKTASLLIASVKAGAVSANATENEINILSEIGLNIGIAFQIRDDLFDYENTNITGKPKGNDIQEGKMTLPLIFALNNSKKREKRTVLNILGKKYKSDNEVETIHNFVLNKGGKDYALKVLNDYKENANKLIMSNFSKSETLEAFKSLLSYIVLRNK